MKTITDKGKGKQIGIHKGEEIVLSYLAKNRMAATGDFEYGYGRYKNNHCAQYYSNLEKLGVIRISRELAISKHELRWFRDHPRHQFAIVADNLRTVRRLARKLEQV